MNEHETLPAPLLALVTIALALATFMQVLDTTIANVSIPSIAGNLGVTSTQGTWVITAFTASNAISMPLTGWLAKRFGEVRLFVFSTLLFAVTSMMCGLSPTYEMLIAARVLQGAVAAPMMPLSQSLLLANYPQHKKGLALAFWAMTATIGPIAGPLLGGYITDNFSWSWIFYINVPIGVISSFVVWQMLKKRETNTSKFPIDFIGLALLVVGVGTLQIMLDKGNELDWFESNTIITLGITAFIAVCFFIAWELYDDHPVIDLTLFKNRNFTIGTVSIALGYTVFLGGGVVFPLWLQTQLGYTAFWAGFASAAVGIFAFLFSPIVGNNLHRLNLRVLVSVSFILFALSYFWMANFTTDIDIIHASLPRLLMGIGMAMFFVPLTSIIISEIHPSKIASAMGVVNFLRILGGGFGTSIAVSMWTTRGDYHHALYSEQITRFSHATEQFSAVVSKMSIPPLSFINHVINQQALTRANDDILLISGYIFLSLIVLIWFAKPPFMPSRAKN
ncbi:DHA2 family efflux MFS transporter permease subunit [Sulfurimonas sp. HSL-1716]|uniref:DHA2 family efflux MFS transporter permease subunit n=1 Tax=Hydrocurvibacter sulfurireducens TaxID=3131937 RepID=UPI0031F86F39